MHVKRNDLNAKSRMKGDFHVRFRERLRVKFPWSTRQHFKNTRNHLIHRSGYNKQGDKIKVDAIVIKNLIEICNKYVNDIAEELHIDSLPF